MSFVCGICGKAQDKRVKPIRLVVKYRNQKTGMLKSPANLTSLSGYQPAKEVNCCPECATLPEFKFKGGTTEPGPAKTDSESEGLTFQMDLNPEGLNFN